MFRSGSKFSLANFYPITVVFKDLSDRSSDNFLSVKKCFFLNFRGCVLLFYCQSSLLSFVFLLCLSRDSLFIIPPVYIFVNSFFKFFLKYFFRRILPGKPAVSVLLHVLPKSLNTPLLHSIRRRLL